MDVKMFDEDAFRKIDKEKLEIITKLYNEMQNKNAEERMQILFTYGMEMKSKGIQFTNKESKLLIDLLKVNLPEKEKSKLDMLSKLIKNM